MGSSKTNKEIAKVLFHLADVLELENVQWKPNAYRKAARTIEAMQEPVAQKSKDELMDIPSVGKGIAEKIEEFVKTGHIKELEKEEKKLPQGVDVLLDVPGLGPKRAKVLAQKLKIKSVDDLRKAAQKGKIKGLEGFGKKREEDILQGIGLLEKGKGRMSLLTALDVAREVCAELEQVQGVGKVMYAGSLRRMKETIGDVDILVTSKNAKSVMDTITSKKVADVVLAKGESKSSIVRPDGVQVDVRVVPQKSYGAALQYFTGSKEHNVKLRQIAIKKGFKLSEYGLFKKDKFVCGKTEEEIYKKLGFEWMPPEVREDHGELQKQVPKLVELKDIKGDLHMHTVWSDGAQSVKEMSLAAQKKGYKYIAITDHSKSEHIAHGMDEKRILKYLKEIEQVQKSVDITILKGSEVSILASGELDYSKDILKRLDIVIASVHSGFKAKDATKRVLNALDNEYVTILGHPTGRIIQRREPLAFNFEKIAQKAKDQKIALEINAQPKRLDLSGELARIANDMGCLFAIDTDSHATSQMRFMELGVGQARRGWVQAKSVINTWSLKKLKSLCR